MVKILHIPGFTTSSREQYKRGSTTKQDKNKCRGTADRKESYKN
jgi:hypothetical protein